MSFSEAKLQVRQYLASRYLPSFKESRAVPPELVADVDMLGSDLDSEVD